MATIAARSNPLGTGEAALARGAWGDTGVGFERAREAGAGPEALEGLAMAAFFLDEAPRVFATRERMPATGRPAGPSMPRRSPPR